MSKCRAFTFCNDNFCDQDLARLAGVECRYIMFGKRMEVGSTSICLQGYVYFKWPRSEASVRRMFEPWEVLPAYGGCKEHLSKIEKLDEVCERGSRPLAIITKRDSGYEKPEARRSATLKRYEEARKAAREGRFEEIPCDLYMRYNAAWHNIHAEQLAKQRMVLLPRPAIEKSVTFLDPRFENDVARFCEQNDRYKTPEKFGF